MATYDKGDQVRVTATFKTAGTLTNTAAKTARQWKPDGTNNDITSDIQTGSDSGIYYVDIDLDQIGTHTIKVASTDAVVAAETIELVVTKSIFDHA